MSKDKNNGPKTITVQVTPKKLRSDLDYFKQIALELGASMVEIIPAKNIIIDERVILKCRIPLCPHYANCLYCPPYGPDIKSVKNALSQYNWAILFALDVLPVESFSDRSKKRNAAEWAKKILKLLVKLRPLHLQAAIILQWDSVSPVVKKLCAGKRDASSLMATIAPIHSRPDPLWKQSE